MLLDLDQRILASVELSNNRPKRPNKPVLIGATEGWLSFTRPKRPKTAACTDSGLISRSPAKAKIRLRCCFASAESPG
jgi:hypothetical protein